MLDIGSVHSAKYEFASSNTTRTTFAFDAGFVLKLAPLADERSGFFIENLSRRLTRSSTYQKLRTRTWPTEAWCAQGVIISYRMEGAGSVSKLRRCSVGGAVSCLSWSPWLARHPALLVSAADNSLYLFRSRLVFLLPITLAQYE
jgi:hypothetical protein